MSLYKLAEYLQHISLIACRKCSDIFLSIQSEKLESDHEFFFQVAW